MPTEPATCEPPEEHRHHRWHWLKFSRQKPEPREWDAESKCWGLAGYWLDESYVAAQGWRYVGPAVPPQEGGVMILKVLRHLNGPDFVCQTEDGEIERVDLYTDGSISADIAPGDLIGRRVQVDRLSVYLSIAMDAVLLDEPQDAP